MIQSIARNPLTESTESKSALRATLLASREMQGSAPDHAARNEALARRLAEVIARYPNAACIGLYWPLAGEFDARDVLAIWLAHGAQRTAALPVVIAPRSALAFHAWHPGMTMKKGRYGIAVPESVRDTTPDVLLIPCVGFDDARYRLGYGGGYYDRTLAAWPGERKPATIGVAFEAGKCVALPREPHDIALDAIVTEAAIY